MKLIVQNLDSYLLRAQRGEDRILMPRQLETVQKIRDFLAAGYTEGHVIKPTGIGKTVIFSKFLEAALVGSTAKALIVGPTKIVLHQNKWKLDEFADITAGRYYGPEKDLSRQVTVTTYHSLRNALKTEKINPKEYPILILDEAHRALGEDTIAAVELFENSIKIGFTATPEFHEEKSVADILPFMIDELSVREAIEGNLLAGLKVFVMTTGLSAENIALKGRDFEEEALSKVINTPERNSFVAKLYLNDRFNGKRTVVYAASRSHGKSLVSAFEKEGISVAYIDGTTPELDSEGTLGRETILQKFKSGEIKVLCNVRVLVEGFDESEAEVCFNAAPTLSKVIAEQRGGRVLRRSRLKDSKVGIIVEILDEFGNSANTPVLFSEIAGASEILSPSNQEEETEKKPKSKSPRTPTSKIKEPGELVEDPEVVMDLTNRNKRQRFIKMFEYAPRGWVYARRLAHELHVKESEIRNVAEGYFAINPDWFKRYLTPTDILITHYHPRLANLVRRKFVNALEGMVTPEEYADKVVLSEIRAEELLEAADELSSSKAVRFTDTAFFSLVDHEMIIRDEILRARQEEALITEEAENLFWQDDDRSDKEREKEYWLSFDEISSESKGVEEQEFDLDPLLHGDDVVSFDDDTCMPLIQDEPAIAPLSDYMRKKVYEWIGLLPRHYIPIVYERCVKENTAKEIRDRLGIVGDIARKERRAYCLLGSRPRLLFMSDFSLASDEQLRSSAGHETELETVATPPEVKKKLQDLTIEYHRLEREFFWIL